MSVLFFNSSALPAAWVIPYNTLVVLIGATVLGIACGVVGTFLLLRKRSLVADAVSHAALPGVAIGFLVAVALGMDGRPLWVLLLGAGIASALGVGALHALAALPRVKDDAAIGVVLSVFFAAGVVLLSVIQSMAVGQHAGLHHFIFGQAATIRLVDAQLIAIVSVLVVLIALIASKELSLLCFDPAYAASLGFSRIALDGLLMAMVTTVTVLGLHVVGALLMVALLIIPAAAARFWSDRLSVIILVAAAGGGTCGFAGTLASAWAGQLPTGPAIVIACGAWFLLSMCFAPARGLVSDAVLRWITARRVERQHLLRAMYERGEIQGDLKSPVALEALLERRRWKPQRLRRLLTRLRKQGEITLRDDGHVLTDTGEHAAKRIVRTHRLWEHYLTSQADIAPSHVDRAADDIEHVLGDELVRELEMTLAQRHDLPGAPGEVPPSPHELAENEFTAESRSNAEDERK